MPFARRNARTPACEHAQYRTCAGQIIEIFGPNARTRKRARGRVQFRQCARARVCKIQLQLIPSERAQRETRTRHTNTRAALLVRKWRSWGSDGQEGAMDGGWMASATQPCMHAACRRASVCVYVDNYFYFIRHPSSRKRVWMRLCAGDWEWVPGTVTPVSRPLSGV